MKTQINSTNIKITSAMQNAIMEKMIFLEKFLKENDDFSITVTKNANKIKIVVLTEYKHKLVKIEHEDDDFYVCLDEIANTTKYQISKIHKKSTEHKKRTDKKALDKEDTIEAYEEDE